VHLPYYGAKLFSLLTDASSYFLKSAQPCDFTVDWSGYLKTSQADRYLSVPICARMSWPFGRGSSWIVFQFSAAGLKQREFAKAPTSPIHWK